MRILLLVALTLGVAACDGGVESSYPAALDLPALSPTALLEADAGRYNTEAVIGEVFVCPPEADCLSEGTITLAERITGEEPVAPAPVVLVDEPEQFEVGRRGRFSVEVGGRASGGSDRRRLTTTLLGYDWL